ARDTQSGGEVALKQLLIGNLAAEQEVQLFLNEARDARDLAHPGIVPILDVGEAEGCPYFTMPLMEGGNLAKRIAALGGNQKEAARIVAIVARAVHKGHQNLVIHRDLKPANILLDAAGQPVVADFGLAKHLGREGMTATGAVIGTPSYMSPEQAKG